MGYHVIAKRIAGISRRFRIHDLRHSFGSVLASAGASELMLKSLFGHSSTRMVQRYARPSLEAMRLVGKTLDTSEARPKSDRMDTNLDTTSEKQQSS